MSEISKRDILRDLPGDVGAHLSQAVELLDAALPKERFAVGFAACHHGKGTSSMAWSFARILAAGRRQPVCIVEANLRTPALADSLQLNSAPGLRDLLDGRAELDATLQQPTGCNASVITAGSNAGTAQFAPPALGKVIEQLRHRFPALIFDAAPLLPYPDTVALGRNLDGIVLVLQAERDRWEVAQHGAQMLEAAGVRVLGAVLNRKPLYIPPWVYRFL